LDLGHRREVRLISWLPRPCARRFVEAREDASYHNDDNNRDEQQEYHNAELTHRF
jgi:hypothetical protein